VRLAQSLKNRLKRSGPHIQNLADIPFQISLYVTGTPDLSINFRIGPYLRVRSLSSQSSNETSVDLFFVEFIVSENRRLRTASRPCALSPKPRLSTMTRATARGRHPTGKRLADSLHQRKALGAGQDPLARSPVSSILT